MLDLTHIDPETFELLCEDLLRDSGFTIESRPARGPDKGKDMLATRYVTDLTGNVDEERYLVECKHYAKSGRSVQAADIGNFLAKVSLHRANRYLLITSTVPSETVRDQLTAVSRDPAHPYKAGFWAYNDIARLLQQHPLIQLRYFSSPRQTKNLASAIADEIATWMKASGALLVESALFDASGTVRLVFRSQSHGIIAAYCVDGEGNLEQLQNATSDARAAGAQEVWLIALSRVTPSARSHGVQDLRVRVTTLGELVSMLVLPHAEEVAAEIAAKWITGEYVELGFEKPTFASDGTELTRDSYSSITAYIDTWLREPNQTQLALLGEFGAGKTWIMLHYAAIQLTEFMRNPVGRRLPVYVPLSSLRADTSILEQIARRFAMKGGSGILGSAASIDILNRTGRLLLLLDGLDEIGAMHSDDQIVSNLQRLHEVVVPGVRIIISSRSHFFRSSWHAQNLFARALEPLGLAIEVMHLTTDVARLNSTQIEEIVRKRAGSNWRRTLSAINETQNMRDLATRPLLLSIMIETLASGDKLAENMFQLYECYANGWLSHEVAKGSSRMLLTDRNRRLIVELLAWQLYANATNAIRSVDFKKCIARILSAHEIPRELLENTGALESELRTAAFLVRDENGEYRFAHKSFLEFFAASWILKSLSTGDLTSLENVAQHDRWVFSPEIDSFLQQGGPLPPVAALAAKSRKAGKKGDAARKVLRLFGTPERE